MFLYNKLRVQGTVSVHLFLFLICVYLVSCDRHVNEAPQLVHNYALLSTYLYHVSIFYQFLLALVT